MRGVAIMVGYVLGGMLAVVISLILSLAIKDLLELLFGDDS